MDSPRFAVFSMHFELALGRSVVASGRQVLVVFCLGFGWSLLPCFRIFDGDFLHLIACMPFSACTLARLIGSFDVCFEDDLL